MENTNPYQAPSAGSTSKQEREYPCSVQAELVYTQQHLIDSLDRMRSQNPLRRLWLWFRYVVATIFSIVGIGLLVTQAFYGALLMMGLVILCFCPKKIDNYFIKRKFQKSPYRNVKYTIELSGEGFSAKSDLDQSILQWRAFTGALVFNDGILLQQGSGMVNWLPNDSFTLGDGHQVARDLLAAKMTVTNAAE